MKNDESSGEEVVDEDAVGLSHVGEAAYEVLRTKHNWYYKTQWNVTSGSVVGQLHQTPLDGWSNSTEPEEGHSDWFPEKMGEIMSRTEVWCDVLSLGPPDGLFLTKIKEALAVIAERANGREEPVTIRMMFGNIVGMPVNCTAVMNALVSDLPENANIQLWIGAWRRGASWNHAKIIAVDGKYLHTGGHNLWDQHYLKFDPVHDLSLELEGRVTHDGHLYANAQWGFIEKKQSSITGQLVDKLPDSLPLVSRSRVTVSEYPKGISEFPPMYRKSFVPRTSKVEDAVPIISIGRYGSMVWRDRPSDDAILAMLKSAKTVIRLALQDLGPVCIPGTKTPLPGCVWPKEYLSALGQVIWQRGVDVEIALSNPGSIPAGLGATEACYGNGWSCVDVAAEIIKTIKKQFPDADDEQLREKVTDNLRVCFIRGGLGKEWPDGMTLGMHAKHFIIDDVCAYIGSQNLYVCDLAEWGVVIDHEETTEQMLQEYWHPMWQSSYTQEDCNVQEVMDGLDIDRDGEEGPGYFDDDKKLEAAARHGSIIPVAVHDFYGNDEDEPSM